MSVKSGALFLYGSTPMHQIKIRMRVRADKAGNPIYIGEVDLPALVDLRAASIMVFPPRPGETDAALVIRAREPERDNSQMEDPHA